MKRQLRPASLLVVLLSLGSLAGTASASPLNDAGRGASAPVAFVPASAEYFSNGVVPGYAAPFEVEAVKSTVGPLEQQPGFGSNHATDVSLDLSRSSSMDSDTSADAPVFAHMQSAWGITATPEPASLALLGTGAFGIVALFRRRTR